MRLHKDSVAGILLDSAGLVALADLPSIKQRTALMGSASFFDLLFLAPGIHTQQDCTAVNGGEPPQAVDMLGDYVFRIENPATVSFLQGIGKPGHLVTVQVDSEERSWYLRHFEHLYIGGFFPSLLYFLGIALTIVSIALLGAIHDYWAMAVLLMLLVARATNTIAVMTRSREGWTGAPERPEKRGDLLIVLSQDRWVRMRGALNDVKRITAGQWLQDPRPLESFAAAFAMLHVYVAAALAINAVTVGSLIIAVLLLVSAGLLGVCNSLTKDLHMWGRRVYVTRREGPYKRRSAMVKALVKELKAPQQVEPASLTMKWVTKMDLLTEEALHATLTESPSTDCNATPKVAPTHGSGSRSPSIDDKAAITPSVLEVPSYLP